MPGSAVGSSAVDLVPNPFSFSLAGHSWQARSEGAAWSHGNEPVPHPCAFQNLVLAKRETGVCFVSSLGGSGLQQLQLSQGDSDLGLDLTAEHGLNLSDDFPVTPCCCCWGDLLSPHSSGAWGSRKASNATFCVFSRVHVGKEAPGEALENLARR